MVSQRQYDEMIMKAAEALPLIAQAIVDANTLKCVIALYNQGDVGEAQMDQIIYAILARSTGPDKGEPAEAESKVRYSEEYRRRKANRQL